MGARERGIFTGGSIFKNQPFTNRPLPLRLLVLQMTNSEHVKINNSVLRCVRMYCLTDG